MKLWESCSWGRLQGMHWAGERARPARGRACGSNTQERWGRVGGSQPLEPLPTNKSNNIPSLILYLYLNTGPCSTRTSGGRRALSSSSTFPRPSAAWLPSSTTGACPSRWTRPRMAWRCGLKKMNFVNVYIDGVCRPCPVPTTPPHPTPPYPTPPHPTPPHLELPHPWGRAHSTAGPPCPLPTTPPPQPIARRSLQPKYHKNPKIKTTNPNNPNPEPALARRTQVPEQLRRALLKYRHRPPAPPYTLPLAPAANAYAAAHAAAGRLFPSVPIRPPSALPGWQPPPPHAPKDLLPGGYAAGGRSPSVAPGSPGRRPRPGTANSGSSQVGGRRRWWAVVVGEAVGDGGCGTGGRVLLPGGRWARPWVRPWVTARAAPRAGAAPRWAAGEVVGGRRVGHWRAGHWCGGIGGRVGKPRGGGGRTAERPNETPVPRAPPASRTSFPHHPPAPTLGLTPPLLAPPSAPPPLRAPRWARVSGLSRGSLGGGGTGAPGPPMRFSGLSRL
jgi:hypothetical protein